MLHKLFSLGIVKNTPNDTSSCPLLSLSDESLSHTKGKYFYSHSIPAKSANSYLPMLDTLSK